MKKYIGCSGYHYDDWKEKFYPANLNKDHWLEFYAKYFNAVEINNTFYEIPDKNTLRNWLDQKPEHFRFALKGSCYVTHMKKLNDSKEHVEKFYQAIEPIQKKVGAVMWQLPPNLHKNLDKLMEFCQNLNISHFVNAIEFRHKSWFSDEVYEILQENNVTLCSISSPDELPEKIPDSDQIYLRFHGTKNWYKDKYFDNELRSWVDKILEQKVNQAFVFFNNDYNAYAVQNAKTFKNLI